MQAISWRLCSCSLEHFRENVERFHPEVRRFNAFAARGDPYIRRVFFNEKSVGVTAASAKTLWDRTIKSRGVDVDAPAFLFIRRRSGGEIAQNRLQDAAIVDRLGDLVERIDAAMSGTSFTERRHR